MTEAISTAILKSFGIDSKETKRLCEWEYDLYRDRVILSLAEQDRKINYRITLVTFAQFHDIYTRAYRKCYPHPPVRIPGKSTDTKTSPRYSIATRKAVSASARDERYWVLTRAPPPLPSHADAEVVISTVYAAPPDTVASIAEQDMVMLIRLRLALFTVDFDEPHLDSVLAPSVYRRSTQLESMLGTSGVTSWKRNELDRLVETLRKDFPDAPSLQTVFQLSSSTTAKQLAATLNQNFLRLSTRLCPTIHRYSLSDPPRAYMEKMWPVTDIWMIAERPFASSSSSSSAANKPTLSIHSGALDDWRFDYTDNPTIEWRMRADRVVGFMSILIGTDNVNVERDERKLSDSDEKTWWVHLVCAEPGGGIGTRLFQRLFQEATAHHVAKIRLHALGGAVEFYRKHKFRFDKGTCSSDHHHLDLAYDTMPNKRSLHDTKEQIAFFQLLIKHNLMADSDCTDWRSCDSNGWEMTRCAPFN